VPKIKAFNFSSKVRHLHADALFILYARSVIRIISSCPTRLFFIDNIPVRAYLFCVLLIFAPLSGEDSIAVDLTQPLFSSKANLLDA
jgi:hypothetical protein